jgi:hypothetical protein
MALVAAEMETILFSAQSRQLAAVVVVPEVRVEPGRGLMEVLEAAAAATRVAVLPLVEQGPQVKVIMVVPLLVQPATMAAAAVVALTQLAGTDRAQQVELVALEQRRQSAARL